MPDRILHSMTTFLMHIHGQLNDFLPYARRDRDFTLAVEGAPAVKDVIESVGVPHTEVDAILAGGISVDFAHLVGDGEHVDVYPPESALPAMPIMHLQPELSEQPRFILDVHLGRLAAYLRLLGFDTAYSNDCEDAVLAERSARENRILLTRDVGLLKRSAVRYGSFVRATQPEHQLEEVVRRYHLVGAGTPFSRCLRCNTPLEPVEKAAVIERLPQRVREEYEVFWRCPQCDQFYWRGSHYQRLRELVERVHE
jgi:uncharacterized protein with PIN domain